MSPIFIELYLDEDVSVRVGDLLRARGFVAVTTRDAGNLGCNDADQLAYATVRRMTLLTHNRRDFERLAQNYFTTGQKHFGVIIAVRRPPAETVRRLLRILNLITRDEIEDQLRYV